MEPLSKTKEFVLSIIDCVRRQVIEDCDDETLTARMYDMKVLETDVFREDDYYTYDEAIKALGIKYNRNRLAELTRKYNIRNRRFKNVFVGFHKDDINKLKLILERQK